MAIYVTLHILLLHKYVFTNQIILFKAYKWPACNFSFESVNKIMRMMEMIANLCMCSFDSPCQHQRKCIEWSMEDMDTGVKG